MPRWHPNRRMHNPTARIMHSTVLCTWCHPPISHSSRSNVPRHRQVHSDKIVTPTRLCIRFLYKYIYSLRFTETEHNRNRNRNRRSHHFHQPLLPNVSHSYPLSLPSILSLSLPLLRIAAALFAFKFSDPNPLSSHLDISHQKSRRESHISLSFCRLLNRYVDFLPRSLSLP